MTRHGARLVYRFCAEARQRIDGMTTAAARERCQSVTRDKAMTLDGYDEILTELIEEARTADVEAPGAAPGPPPGPRGRNHP